MADEYDYEVTVVRENSRQRKVVVSAHTELEAMEKAEALAAPGDSEFWKRSEDDDTIVYSSMASIKDTMDGADG